MPRARAGRDGSCETAGMPPTLPTGATFRRAEGLVLIVRPCRGLSEVDVIARRQKRDTRLTLSMDDARLIARLGRWSSADEVGAAPERLAALVEKDCLFWSPERPERDLGGAPLASLEGRLALRDNVQPVPVVAGRVQLKRELLPFPEMLRRGSEPVEVAGTAFVSVEWDQDIGSVAFACCPKHGRAVVEVAVALDGTRTADAIAPRVNDGDHDDKRAILTAMNDLGLLERHEPRRWDNRPSVTWMGHAGVLYEAAGRRILVDTIAFPRSRPTRHATAPFDLRDLGTLDAVVITHGDNDHFHPGLLHRLPRATPVVIPATRDPQPYQVDMRRVLDLLGFERIVEVDEWQRLAFGDVTVVAAPFRGEDWGLALACRSYLIASPELTIYLNADSTSTPEAEARIAAEHRVDVAFLGVTGAEESYVMPPGFGYGNFYSDWVPRERHNQWVRMCNGPRESAAVAMRLGARYAFGYAAGGAPGYGLMYCDRGSHAELARELRALGAATRPLDLALGVSRALDG